MSFCLHNVSSDVLRDKALRVHLPVHVNAQADLMPQLCNFTCAVSGFLYTSSYGQVYAKRGYIDRRL